MMQECEGCRDRFDTDRLRVSDYGATLCLKCFSENEESNRKADELIHRIANERGKLIAVARAAAKASRWFGCGYAPNTPGHGKGDEIRKELSDAVNALPQSIKSEIQEPPK